MPDQDINFSDIPEMTDEELGRARRVRGVRAGKSVRPLPEPKIDFSDIPEMSEAQLRAMQRKGRPKQ